MYAAAGVGRDPVDDVYRRYLPGTVVPYQVLVLVSGASPPHAGVRWHVCIVRIDLTHVCPIMY
jgi:hypothetical protein